MAATSTNKQPLLVDHVLHYVVNLDTSINDGMDIVGTNTASLLIDATNTDGAIIEDIYTIARGTTASTVNLYISSARDYLRPNEAVFVGSVTSATTKGNVVRWEEMPKTLVPAPQVGTESFNRAFYLPKGYALWAARDSTSNSTDGPLLGCQGGWY
jgi:hypothetical protein